MATVAALAALFDALMGQNADSFNTGRKLALLSAAGHEAWKCLVAHKDDDNWFVGASQSATPGNADYFPNLVLGVREYPLPPNFHQLRAIEIVTPTDRKLRFERSEIDNEEFERRRSNTATLNDSTFKYVITGSAPGTFMLDAAPALTIDIKLWYVQTFTKWTALTSTTDQIPAMFDTLMCEWALKRAELGIGDERWTAFETYWQESVYRTITTYRRHNRGPIITRGVFEED